MRRCLLAIWLVGVAPAWVCAAPVKPGKVAVELIAERSAIVPGQRFTVALRLQMDEHWHTYWKNPGDSGLPTSLIWRLPTGFSAGELQWPYPQRISAGRLTNYGYEGEALLLVDVAAPEALKTGASVTLAALAKWLECKDVCIPREAALELALPVAVNAATSAWTAQFKVAREALPRALTGFRASATRAGKGLELALAPTRPVAPFGSFYFFSEREGMVEPSRPQLLKKVGERYVLSLPIAVAPTGDFSVLEGVLVADQAWPGMDARAVKIRLPMQ